jgi:HEAT repeat protein
VTQKHSQTSQNAQNGSREIEPEADHLRRIAQELAGANRPITARLAADLRRGDLADRFAAAVQLGRLGDRESIQALRVLLESDEPSDWQVAVHGLRSARDRAGWLCLEGVAQDSIAALADNSPGVHRAAALRLLAMGRTKTMDRLFRAIDGHSRSIPAEAARHFVGVALESLPDIESQVLALRLGYPSGHGHTTAEVAARVGVSEDAARQWEARGWERVQSPRSWVELNIDNSPEGLDID